MAVKAVGVWLGFPVSTDLKREGIGRFIKFIVKALLDRYDIVIELWAFEDNRKIVEQLFGSEFRRYYEEGRLRICSEIVEGSAGTFVNLDQVSDEKKISAILARYINFAVCKEIFPFFLFEKLLVFLKAIQVLKGLFKRAGSAASSCRLCQVANSTSKVDVFLISYVGLDNSLGLKFPTVVMTYDLVTFEFMEDFVNSGYGLISMLDEMRRVICFANEITKRANTFVGISWHVMNTQVRKYLRNIEENRVDIVYIPIMMSQNVVPTGDDQIREKFQITGKYIFYPSHIRPYKGVADLIRAVEVVRKRGLNLAIVLTGRGLSGDVEAAALSRDPKIQSGLFFTGDVNEEDLAGLYKGAEIVACPSHYEGGIHQPLIEAIYWDIPVVATRLPQTIERLRFHEIDEQLISFYEPGNVNQFADAIWDISHGRDEAVVRQREVLGRLSSYRWSDAAEKMYSILAETSDLQV